MPSHMSLNKKKFILLSSSNGIPKLQSLQFRYAKLVGLLLIVF